MPGTQSICFHIGTRLSPLIFWLLASFPFQRVQAASPHSTIATDVEEMVRVAREWHS